MRDVFFKLLYAELTAFKESLMRQDKRAIFNESYKIEVFINLYEILVEQAEYLSDAMLQKLICQSSGVLESLYESWLKKKDDTYLALQEHVTAELSKEPAA